MRFRSRTVRGFMSLQRRKSAEAVNETIRATLYFFFEEAPDVLVFFALGARELAAVGAAVTVGFLDGDGGIGPSLGPFCRGAAGLIVTDRSRTLARSASSDDFLIGSSACFFFGLDAGAAFGVVPEV